MTRNPAQPFEHRWRDGRLTGLPLGKIVCVGRNYAAHARELNNPVPEQPLLFMKPATSACDLHQSLSLADHQGEVHFETELAVLIGAPLKQASSQEARQAIMGYGLALDLTLRDLQNRLKAEGHPWERAKAFDGACPLSNLIPADELPDPGNIRFSLTLDGQLQQQGNTRDMITPVVALLAHISETFTLRPGDLVLTGTPAGVGALRRGQHLKLDLDGRLTVETSVE